ncbi:MAG: hypothetical protein GIKADHBN_02476 [Phycisphaerales bacterium]|nr:hypothetical protein [Phycisphaerales bacterium]
MTPCDHALSLARFVRSVSDGMLRNWPEEKLTHQNTPHDNHPLWVLGHIANTDAWIGSVVGADVSVPASYDKLFGMGSKPSAQRSDYPSFAELRAQFDRNRAGLIAWFEKATPQQLAVDLREKTGSFANDPVDALLKCAWHEGWHFGQVSTLRRSLGLPPLMG